MVGFGVTNLVLSVTFRSVRPGPQGRDAEKKGGGAGGKAGRRCSRAAHEALGAARDEGGKRPGNDLRGNIFAAFFDVGDPVVRRVGFSFAVPEHEDGSGRCDGFGDLLPVLRVIGFVRPVRVTCTMMDLVEMAPADLRRRCALAAPRASHR